MSWSHKWSNGNDWCVYESIIAARLTLRVTHVPYMELFARKQLTYLLENQSCQAYQKQDDALISLLVVLRYGSIGANCNRSWYIMSVILSIGDKK